MEILEKVRDAIRKVALISPSETWNDEIPLSREISLDLIDQKTLFILLEKEFDIRLPESVAEDVSTLQIARIVEDALH